MKIIDAHLHFCPQSPYFDEIAARAGHQNSAAHLEECFRSLGIAGGIVMGNRGLALEEHPYPDFLRYCVGVEADCLDPALPPAGMQAACDRIEAHLKRPDCAGIKLYPGYSPVSINDRRYEPVYELAAAYQKPVAVHMGQTAGSRAFLKYSHPLTMDEAAVLHPRVSFVMCHFGNPWLMDAAAVIEKDENVCADLSGLLEGNPDIPLLLRQQEGYVSALKTWIAYTDRYDRLMFGTDWPLANYQGYLQFTRAVIPQEHWDDVFWKTAARVYGLSL